MQSIAGLRRRQGAVGELAYDFPDQTERGYPVRRSPLSQMRPYPPLLCPKELRPGQESRPLCEEGLGH